MSDKGYLNSIFANNFKIIISFCAYLFVTLHPIFKYEIKHDCYII